MVYKLYILDVSRLPLNRFSDATVKFPITTVIIRSLLWHQRILQISHHYYDFTCHYIAECSLMSLNICDKYAKCYEGAFVTNCGFHKNAVSMKCTIHQQFNNLKKKSATKNNNIRILIDLNIGRPFLRECSSFSGWEISIF